MTNPDDLLAQRMVEASDFATEDLDDVFRIWSGHKLKRVKAALFEFQMPDIMNIRNVKPTEKAPIGFNLFLATPEPLTVADIVPMFNPKAAVSYHQRFQHFGVSNALTEMEREELYMLGYNVGDRRGLYSDVISLPDYKSVSITDAIILVSLIKYINDHVKIEFGTAHVFAAEYERNLAVLANNLSHIMYSLMSIHAVSGAVLDEPQVKARRNQLDMSYRARHLIIIMSFSLNRERSGYTITFSGPHGKVAFDLIDAVNHMYTTKFDFPFEFGYLSYGTDGASNGSFKNKGNG